VLAEIDSVLTDPGTSTWSPEPIAIDVFPNPVSDYLYFTASADERSKLEAELMSLTGATVAHFDMPLPPAIDVAQYSPGMYLLRISDGKVVITFKVFCTSTTH